MTTSPNDLAPREPQRAAAQTSQPAQAQQPQPELPSLFPPVNISEDDVGITLNKNVIADDSRKPMDPSGIRFGTPAITTRKFKEKECAQVAEWMIEALKDRKDAKKLKIIRADVAKLCRKFPIPQRFV